MESVKDRWGEISTHASASLKNPTLTLSTTCTDSNPITFFENPISFDYRLMDLSLKHLKETRFTDLLTRFGAFYDGPRGVTERAGAW